MTSRARKNVSAPCPCGSGQDYAACCAPLHGGAPAANAEALMRSRYSAYVLVREDYLLASWHASTRPARLGLHDEPATRRPRWLGLEILRHDTDGDTATVEFVARCRIGGRAQRMHEISRFVRENGRWFYLVAANEPK